MSTQSNTNDVTTNDATTNDSSTSTKDNGISRRDFLKYPERNQGVPAVVDSEQQAFVDARRK